MHYHLLITDPYQEELSYGPQQEETCLASWYYFTAPAGEGRFPFLPSTSADEKPAPL